MTIRLEAKRSDEVRAYQHDWSAFLGDDTITSADMVATGVTIDSFAVDAGNKSVSFTVSGGADGTPGRLTQTIEYAGGTETEVFDLNVVDDPLVSLAEAKTYMRILTSDLDSEICMKLVQAKASVLDYVTREAVTLDEKDVLRAAIFEVTMAMMEGRPALNGDVKNMLRRFRDPSLA